MSLHVGSLDDVPDDFGPNYLKCELSLKKKRKAKAFVSGCYIETLKITLEDGDLVRIRGEVYPSQRKSESRHVVNMDINKKEKRITDAFCQCKQGNCGTCSHSLAVTMAIEQWKVAGYKEVPSLLSSTSLPQQWDKPRGGKILSEPVSRMVFASPGNVTRKRKPVMANFTDNRKVHLTNEHIAGLKSLTDSPISYLVEKINDCSKYMETPIGPQLVGSGLSYHAHLMESIHQPRDEYGCGDITLPVDSNIGDRHSQLLTDNSQHWEELAVTFDKSREIEKKTRLQSSSKEWFHERQMRITASNFGSVMNRKKKVNDIFLRNTFFQGPFTSKATSYGQQNEKNAKIMYIKKTGSHLHDVGLIVNPVFPFLGASPDAVVCENGSVGLVEVKCPYSARRFTLKEAVNGEIEGFYLVKDGDNVVLDRKHKYYFQIQGQLLISGLNFCDFVVYFKDDIFIQRIPRDVAAIDSLLERMVAFYISDFKPYLKKHVLDTK